MDDLKSTSIPVKGNRAYVQAIKAVATANNISIAQLVRQALDNVYGEEIKKAVFFQQSVASKLQDNSEGNKGK